MEAEFMKYAGARSPPAQFLPAQFLPAQFPYDAIPDVGHELFAPDLGIKSQPRAQHGRLATRGVERLLQPRLLLVGQRLEIRALLLAQSIRHICGL